MKQSVKNLAMLLMVALCGIMISCSNEENEVGGDGSKVAVVNGTSYNSLVYGYWSNDYGEISLYFTNMNFKSSSVPQKVQMLTLNIEGKSSGIKTGEHKADAEFYSANAQTEKYDVIASGNVTVKIAQNGSDYIISIPATTIDMYVGDMDLDNIEDDADYKSVPFSFTYTGQLERFDFE